MLIENFIIINQDWIKYIMSNSKFPLDRIKKIYYLLKDKYFDYYLPFFYKKFKYTEAFFFKSDIQTNLYKFLDKN